MLQESLLPLIQLLKLPVCLSTMIRVAAGCLQIKIVTEREESAVSELYGVLDVVRRTKWQLFSRMVKRDPFCSPGSICRVPIHILGSKAMAGARRVSGSGW